MDTEPINQLSITNNTTGHNTGTIFHGRTQAMSKQHHSQNTSEAECVPTDSTGRKNIMFLTEKVLRKSICPPFFL